MCPHTAYKDTCILQCKPGYGGDRAVYTCSDNGEWVSLRSLQCIDANVFEINPVVVGEPFRLPVPGKIVSVVMWLQDRGRGTNRTKAHDISPFEATSAVL